LVLERTDHCLLVGKDAYRFARAQGHEHVELLSEASRKKWMCSPSISSLCAMPW
jgi:isoaspartyl peptidase/L-asparaginase-like protein (Ntn-hydrolase superfamily)